MRLLLSIFLQFLFFGTRSVLEKYRAQQGRELAWGYKTLLKPYASAVKTRK